MTPAPSGRPRMSTSTPTGNAMYIAPKRVIPTRRVISSRLDRRSAASAANRSPRARARMMARSDGVTQSASNTVATAVAYPAARNGINAAVSE